MMELPKNNKKQKQKIDPVLAGIIIGTGVALCLGLFLTGVVNVSNSAVAQIEIPEREVLRVEILERDEELRRLKEETEVTDGNASNDKTLEIELKDAELRDLEAKMAKIDNGSYTRLRCDVIKKNLAWFIGSLVILVMTIVLARWMKNEMQGERLKNDTREIGMKNKAHEKTRRTTK